MKTGYFSVIQKAFTTHDEMIKIARAGVYSGEYAKSNEMEAFIALLATLPAHAQPDALLFDLFDKVADRAEIAAEYNEIFGDEIDTGPGRLINFKRLGDGMQYRVVDKARSGCRDRVVVTFASGPAPDDNGATVCVNGGSYKIPGAEIEKHSARLDISPLSYVGRIIESHQACHFFNI